MSTTRRGFFGLVAAVAGWLVLPSYSQTISKAMVADNDSLYDSAFNQWVRDQGLVYVKPNPEFVWCSEEIIKVTSVDLDSGIISIERS